MFIMRTIDVPHRALEKAEKVLLFQLLHVHQILDPTDVDAAVRQLPGGLVGVLQIARVSLGGEWGAAGVGGGLLLRSVVPLLLLQDAREGAPGYHGGLLLGGGI